MNQQHSSPTEDRDVDSAPPLGTEGQDTFAMLMQRVSAGDETAFRVLAERYTSHIMRVVRGSLPGAMRRRFDSDDFVQTVWRLVCRRRDQLQQFTNPDELIGYLVVMTRNRVLSERRKQIAAQSRDLRRETSLSSPGAGELGLPSLEQQLHAPGDTPSRVAIGREALAGLLSELSERDQRILELTVSGLTCEEVAEELQVSARTVRRVLAFSRERLGGAKE